jgi:hypothetical protein
MFEFSCCVRYLCPVTTRMSTSSRNQPPFTSAAMPSFADEKALSVIMYPEDGKRWPAHDVRLSVHLLCLDLIFRVDGNHNSNWARLARVAWFSCEGSDVPTSFMHWFTHLVHVLMMEGLSPSKPTLCSTLSWVNHIIDLQRLL